MNPFGYFDEETLEDVFEDLHLRYAEGVDKDKMECNKPRTTPDHPTKSHIVKCCGGPCGDGKLIRFGQQGKKVGTLKGTAGKPKEGESEEIKAKRKAFKDRHAKNIARGKISPAWWADKYKW